MGTSSYADLDRPPLRPLAVARALRRGGSTWRVQVLPRSPSTNAEVAAAARAGAAAGLVVVAEAQTAGRGRLGRSWTSPARAGLTLSVLLAPDPVDRARWPLLPLLAGVALVDAVVERAEVAVSLKWPNDLLAPDGRKLAGILAESVDTPTGPAVVLGVGMNVSTTPAELAELPAATSLAACGATVDRATLLLAVLRRLEGHYRQWLAAGGAPGPVLAAYRPACGTIGRRVRLELPGGATVTGTATGVDGTGQLLVAGDEAGAGGSPGRAFPAADVLHLRAG